MPAPQAAASRMPAPQAATSTPHFGGVPRILNGGLAGIVGVTCVFPIDLAKTRLQNQRIGPDGKLQYDGIVDCARKTWNSGGRSVFSKVRAIYSGSAVNILLITPEKAIKLCANDFFRYHLAVPGQKQLSVFRGMIAGGLTAVFQMTVTTPMELLKIQLQDQGRTAAKGDKKLTAFTLARNLVRQHGFAGLYKGLNSTLARDVTFSAIYFPLFAYLDSLGPRRNDGSGDAVAWVSFMGGLVSGAASAFIVTPFDVVKTRIQTIKKGANDMVYKGVPDAFCSILRTEGPKALFKGAGCRVLVIAPLFGIAQTVYYIGVAEWILGMPKAHHV
uniref:Mitochondrial glutamate carrier 1 n=1 Tax=Haemonchus contortus TaxID=6289 RepID=A0A7I4YD42_HAECO|nr:Mitochondrial substrate solute carrier domain containing protein [Haemonchus contortus]